MKNDRIKKETLMIPMGYGNGDIVYDNKNNPYIIQGVCCKPVYYIQRISRDVAGDLIRKGAKAVN